eukprot:scaffold1954_cov268-Pinguiococcus_pyrenoidosus.AAC.183
MLPELRQRERGRKIKRERNKSGRLGKGAGARRRMLHLMGESRSRAAEGAAGCNSPALAKQLLSRRCLTGLLTAVRDATAVYSSDVLRHLAGHKIGQVFSKLGLVSYNGGRDVIVLRIA